MRFKITIDGNDNIDILEKAKNDIIEYLTSNCICDISNDNFDISITIHKQNNMLDIEIRDSFVDIYVDDKTNIDKLCDAIIDKYNIDSINFISKSRDIESIDMKEKKISINYDKINNMISRGIDDPYIPMESAQLAKSTGSIYYSVRRSLNDASSEKWSGESLTSAIRECNKYAGYKVFSNTGDIIYTSNKHKVALEKNNISAIKSRRIIRNNGVGIRVRDKNLKLINVPDGTEVIVSKISSKKSEIIIHLDDEMIKTEVATSILSKV